ncbi:MAG: 5-formyltetrahydrofolate cyclo-ligase, partial [Sphingomonadaceae bacterium]|nr:5-formyltetrahydrofolate cyclo-ligase [Sphingomonadaceae bacterium]
AMGDEADPSAIAAAARAAGATLCLPRLGEEGTMDFVISDLDIAALVTGPLRIPQPGPDASIVEPDLIVAPLLGFDRAMGRIGQGKGYYDRAFVAHPDAFRLGLAWSAQEAPTIPMEPWDMRLHAVLTEREWIGAAP